MAFLRITVLIFGVLTNVGACSSWKPFSSPEGRYQIEMPVNPKTQTVSMNTPVGRVDALQAISQLGEVRYQAGYADLPADLVRRASAKSILQSLQQQESSALKAKIIDVDWDDDLQGLSFFYLVEAGESSRNRYLIRNNRLYLLQVFGPLPALQGEAAGRFFSSFQVTP